MSTPGQGLLLLAYLRCRTLRDAYNFLKSHPEIISEHSVATLQQMYESARQGGQDQAARIIENCREPLARSLESGVDGAFIEEGLSWICLSGPALEQLANAVIEPMDAYRDGHAIGDLNQAITAADSIFAHPAFERVPRALRAAICLDAGHLRWMRFQTTHDRRDLARVMELWEIAVRTTDHNAHYYSKFLNYYLDAVFEETQLTGNVANLSRAIELAEESLKDLSGINRAQLLGQLASANRMRGRHTGDVTDFEQAVAAGEESLRQWPTDDKAGRAGAQQTLGNALQDRYLRTGQLTDLGAALDLFTAAVDATPDTPESAGTLALRLTNLANAQRDRYARTGDAADLDEAIDARRKVLTLTPNDDPQHYAYLTNLGNNLQARFLDSHHPADLEESVACHEAALRATEGRGVDARWLSAQGLAAALRKRFGLTHDRSDLDRAIALSESQLRELDPNMPARAGFLIILANALWDRSRSYGTADDDRRARDLYRATLTSSSTTPEHVVTAARSWAAMAIQAQAWPDLAESAQTGLAVIDRLFKTQLTRSEKEAWLRDAEGLSAVAAFALAKMSRLPEAVVALETGRARLLNEAFELGDARLDGLEQAGRHDLADQYMATAHRVRQLGLEAAGLIPLSVPAASLAEQQRQALADLDKVLAEIREVPGLAHFLGAPSIEDVFSAAENAPIVYLTAAEPGGLALIVSGRPQTVRNVWLQQLSRDELFEKSARYINGLAAHRLGTDPAIMDDLCQWLWAEVIGPVAAELASEQEIVLVPTGWLALLPLHAAWRRDGGERRYLIDDFAVSYAVNTRAHSVAIERAGRMPAEHNYLVVQDPRPTSAAPLWHTTQEADAVLDGVPGLRLQHEHATKARVRSALPDYSVLHFACHGSVNPGAPLRSRLILANDELLTVGEIITDELDKTRLVVLSACETAIVGARLVDEVVNFPSGMLQAGAAACIGSLWQVSDAATALLMRRFYEIWRESRTTPTEALRRAQRWLRDSSNEQLVEAEYIRAPGPAAETATQSFWRSARMYSHPYYWAAFCCYGA